MNPSSLSSPPYKLAEQINARVNSNVRYTCDRELYGKPEFWEIAYSKGDCEDYALAKRQQFIEQGFGDAVRLATCRHRETWSAVGDIRHRCLKGYPMHEFCAWRQPITSPAIPANQER